MPGCDIGGRTVMTTNFTNEHPFTTDRDISSVAFWGGPWEQREETFSWFRKNAPVAWQPPFEVPGYDFHGQKGFWALTRAAEISYVSKNDDDFVSGAGVSLAPVPYEMELQASFFLAMDSPRHPWYRKIVAGAFTPKSIARLTDQIHGRARKIVDDLVEMKEVEFVSQCSALLPMQTVCDMIGIPPSLHEPVRLAADRYVGELDASIIPEGVAPLAFRVQQAEFLHEVGRSLAEHRRRNPGDDIITNLVQGEVDGKKLTDLEIGAFMVLMSVAGNDTTKQTTSHTVISLAKHPEQRDWLLEDFDGRINGAVEEMVRHAAPVMTFARMAVRDLEVGGQQIRAGDKLGLLYCSGLRDETVFPDPERFDLSRPRSAHVGFGGGGAHYCLGAGVAKTQLKALFGELLTRVPKMEVGEPDHQVSNFLRMVRRLPVTIG